MSLRIARHSLAMAAANDGYTRAGLLLLLGSSAAAAAAAGDAPGEAPGEGDRDGCR